MSIQDLWEKILGWTRLKRRHRFDIYADIDESTGLIGSYDEIESDSKPKQVLVKKTDTLQSIEKLQEGFNRLVEQLDNINTNFSQHVAQQKEMMERIAQMPRLMENFPEAISNQQKAMDLLCEQFKTSTAKTQDFVDAMKKLPEESMRQTDTLVSINRQLSVSADTDIILNENFVKFSATLEKLNHATESQTDSVVQMSKTFAASDRYLKYLVAKQNKRFMIVFIVAVSVCVLSILSLVTVIAFIK